MVAWKRDRIRLQQSQQELQKAASHKPIQTGQQDSFLPHVACQTHAGCTRLLCVMELFVEGAREPSTQTSMAAKCVSKFMLACMRSEVSMYVGLRCSLVCCPDPTIILSDFCSNKNVMVGRTQATSRW